MAVNRFSASCVYCDGRVRARAGTLFRSGDTWKVAHLACADEPAAGRVMTIYSPVSGNSWTQNSRGICEDAPACGCCTF